MKTTCFLLFLIAFNANAAGPFGIGQKDFALKDSSRDRKLSAHVWYPVDSSEKMSTIPNGPFVPITAAKNAPIAKTPAHFPVVLLSHGSGGKADKLFWITERFVRNGSIVLAVDHTGNMTGDNSADGMVRIWDRAIDLSFALDQLVRDAQFKAHMDLSRVAAVGHSAGGTTVLLLAGGRFAASQLSSMTPHCHGTKDPYYAKLCDQMDTIDFKSYSKETVEKSYADPRVKAVVAFDPGGSQWFLRESLENLKTKARIFVRDKLAHPQDEILSQEFLKLLPSSTEIVPNAVHFTFLQACKANFPAKDPELSELCFQNDLKIKIQKSVGDRTLDFINGAWEK